MSGLFRGDSMDFKSLSLRAFRALRGYAMDFKAGGMREFPGNSGEERGNHSRGQITVCAGCAGCAGCAV